MKFRAPSSSSLEEEEEVVNDYTNTIFNDYDQICFISYIAICAKLYRRHESDYASIHEKAWP